MAINEERNSATDLWIGTELGVLKEVSLGSGTFVNHGILSELDSSQGITSMCRSALENSQEKICMGLKNGTIKTFDLDTRKFHADVVQCDDSPVRGIVALANGKVSACSESGHLKVWDSNMELLNERKLGDNIQALSISTTAKLLASGGKENDVKVWDCEDLQKPVFAAKNVSNDFLNLRVPVWVTGVCFLHEDDNKLLATSGYKHVRLYDRLVQRRPVLDVTWHEHPITAATVLPGNTCAIVGNSAGYMSSIDLRTGKVVGVFKGNAGSIRSVVCHPRQPIVACCGLDRFVKVYDLTSRHLQKKVYLKSTLNCMLMTENDIMLNPNDTIGCKRPGDANGFHADNELRDGQDGDDVWDEMQKVEDAKKVKRKKRIKSSEE